MNVKKIHWYFVIAAVICSLGLNGVYLVEGETTNFLLSMILTVQLYSMFETVSERIIAEKRNKV